MIKFVYSAIFPTKDTGGFVELDKNMKRKLKITAFVILVIFLVTVLLSSSSVIDINLNNFIVLTPNVVEILEKYPSVVIEYFFYFILLILVAIFSYVFYLIFDITKIHYRIDKITFRVIADLNQHIYEKTALRLECKSSECAFMQKIADSEFQKSFRHRFFYNFLNRDLLGFYNQKEKRRYVFEMWNKYYTFNFIWISFFLIYLWLGPFILVKLPSSLPVWLIIYIAIPILIWNKSISKRGKFYKENLIQLAIDQIDSIFDNVNNEAIDSLKNIVGNCPNSGCKLNQ